MLSQDDIESYERDGYVIPAKCRFPEDECEALRAELDEVLPDRLNGHGVLDAEKITATY